MSNQFMFTSESVTEGHPDKIADQIADQIADRVLDGILEQDRKARVACEVLVTKGIVFVTGEITTNAYVEISDIVRETVRDIGYTDPERGFAADTCGVITAIGTQSPDIAIGVDGKGIYKEQGAGDQGLMFGYAKEGKAVRASDVIVKGEMKERKEERLVCSLLGDHVRSVHCV